LLDVFPVCSQFGRTVGEDINCGLQCRVVGNDPFGVRLDCSGWQYQACNKLEVSEFLLSLVIKGDRVERGEDLVKIDCLPQKEVGPFHVRELWTAWGVNKQGLCEKFSSADWVCRRLGERRVGVSSSWTTHGRIMVLIWQCEDWCPSFKRGGWAHLDKGGGLGDPPSGKCVLCDPGEASFLCLPVRSLPWDPATPWNCSEPSRLLR
jgi:hypothetical protein